MTKAERNREYQKRYREKMGEEAWLSSRRKLAQNWVSRNRERYNQAKTEYRFKLKIEAISLYSRGSMSCALCGYNADIDALTLDHINDDGAEHRRELRCSSRNGSAGTTMYERIKALGWIDGLQVLCANCNTIKAIRHKRKRTADEMHVAVAKPTRWKNGHEKSPPIPPDP